VVKSSTKPGKPASSIRALVVDDNELVRTFIEHVLRDAGYQTATAEDGMAARDYVLQKGAPDVVVTDESMPRMTGHEFARWVRDQRADVKVLFLSGYGTNALPNEMCLQKPCTMRELLHAMTVLTRLTESSCARSAR
jgi:CheY-like chemotaxis protein